jgi:hypothetical protein
MKDVYKRRKCPPRCPKSFRCDRKTKNRKTRRCNPFIKKSSLTKKLKRNVSVKKSLSPKSSPKMTRYAKFYNIGAIVEVHNQIDLSRKQVEEKFNNNINNELNSNDKYKIGDILFTGGENFPFAIVDEKDGKLTFKVNDNSENLPWSIMPKVMANHIKYQKLFEGDELDKLGDVRDIFISGSQEDMIVEYIKAGIW